MKPRWGLALAIALPGILVILILSFPAFFYREILLPASQALWLLLRLSALAVGQEVYWYLILLAAAAWGCGILLRRRGLRPEEALEPPAPPSDPVAARRASLLLNAESPPETDTLRKELSWLLASVYASRGEEVPKYRTREALASGEIPLPEEIRRFVFPPSGARVKTPSLLSDPDAWARAAASRVGRALRPLLPPAANRKRYFRRVEEALAFLERELEKNDGQD